MTLPAFALFPPPDLRSQIPPQEWTACLDSWLVLVDSHLSLSKSKSATISTKDESLANFLASFMREIARNGAGILGTSPSAKKLLRDCFSLTFGLLQSDSPPTGLAQWDFLADLCRVYGKKRAASILSQLSPPAQSTLETSMSALKKFLVKNLGAGISEGDLRAIEERLDRLGDLIHASPSVAEFFLAGSDFLDGLVVCFKIMNPPLRKVLISTTYLCLMGVAEGGKMSMLTDALYYLKAAADAHKTGPLNVNDSLVAELVTSTPLIPQLERKLSDSATPSSRTESVLSQLATFKKPLAPGFPRPKRLIRRKLDKGKGVDHSHQADEQEEMHIHRLSQITQIQDLFPDLGTLFISALLDHFDESTERVIAALLDASPLPPHLASLDRSASLTTTHFIPNTNTSHLAPRPTPPFHATYTPNLTDDDDDPLLTASLSNLQLGKRTDRSADTLLAAPTVSKATILSALAAFDSDDDERDDTYDAADVGGTVDARADDQPLTESAEGVLFKAWTATPQVFARTAEAKKSAERARVRLETGMSDEQVEGWGVMITRDGGMRRRLMARWGEWRGEQEEVQGGKWRAGEEEEGEQGNGEGGQGQGQRGGMHRGRGGGRGRGRGRGRGGGPPPEPDSELARRRKEANKSSRANHNRRDGRARKMARGGGLPG